MSYSDKLEKYKYKLLQCGGVKKYDRVIYRDTGERGTIMNISDRDFTVKFDSGRTETSSQWKWQEEKEYDSYKKIIGDYIQSESLKTGQYFRTEQDVIDWYRAHPTPTSAEPVSAAVEGDMNPNILEFLPSHIKTKFQIGQKVHDPEYTGVSGIIIAIRKGKFKNNPIYFVKAPSGEIERCADESLELVS